jgi:lipid A 3-O-deacylase
VKSAKIIIFVFITVLSVRSIPAQSVSVGASRFLFLSLENDQLGGGDRGYTGGIKLSLMSAPLSHAENNPWLKWIPFVNRPDSATAISFSLGQHIYTPLDLAAGELIIEDRPYAGALYLSLGIHNRTHLSQDVLEFTLGVVGPSSGAEQTQNLFHDLFGNISAQGWANQLKDEFVFACVYEHKQNVLSTGRPDGAGFDIIPHFGGGVGNLHTYAGGGVQFRWGWRLPDEFGSFVTRPGGFRNIGFRQKGDRSLYIYGGINNNWVIRNIFLDGSTLRESHSVEKKPFTADIFLGLTTRIQSIQISLDYVYWTKRYRIETKNQIIGSLNLTYCF